MIKMIFIVRAVEMKFVARSDIEVKPCQHLDYFRFLGIERFFLMVYALAFGLVSSVYL